MLLAQLEVGEEVLVDQVVGFESLEVRIEALVE